MGDLNISGAGPSISNALDILQAWSESYGYIPRCYAETESADFWGVCNEVSEQFYIDTFTRNGLVGDDQDTDPEDGDEELVPDVAMHHMWMTVVVLLPQKSVKGSSWNNIRFQVQLPRRPKDEQPGARSLRG